MAQDSSVMVLDWNFHLQKQPSGVVFRKRCSENMQQIYKRTPMSKCDFNKVAKQLHWDHTSVSVLSCKFAAYFWITFSLKTPSESCFCICMSISISNVHKIQMLLICMITEIFARHKLPSRDANVFPFSHDSSEYFYYINNIDSIYEVCKQIPLKL